MVTMDTEEKKMDTRSFLVIYGQPDLRGLFPPAELVPNFRLRQQTLGGGYA